LDWTRPYIYVITKRVIVFNALRVYYKEGKFPGHELEIVSNGVHYPVDKDGRVPVDFPQDLFDANRRLLVRLL